MAYYYWNKEVEQATRRKGAIAEAIRPITYKETPGQYGAFLLVRPQLSERQRS
jgi:hypothetical protein